MLLLLIQNISSVPHDEKGSRLHELSRYRQADRRVCRVGGGGVWMELLSTLGKSCRPPRPNIRIYTYQNRLDYHRSRYIPRLSTHEKWWAFGLNSQHFRRLGIFKRWLAAERRRKRRYHAHVRGQRKIGFFVFMCSCAYVRRGCNPPREGYETTAVVVVVVDRLLPIYLDLHCCCVRGRKGTFVRGTQGSRTI